MTEETALAEDELRRVLALTGESDGIDCKGPVGWDGDHAAGLTKDVLAFANSRGGGLLVIGKAERDDGTFDLAGLSPAQAASFDTTKVAAFVNRYASPPVRLCCCPADRDGKLFVVIRVAEFDEVPVLCMRDYPHPQKPREFILRARTIYVRNANAESAPLTTTDELRALISVATAKQRDQIAATVRSVLTGASIIPPPPPEEVYATDRQTLEAELAPWLARTPSAASDGWRFEFYPAVPRARWADEYALLASAQSWPVEVEGWTFPAPPPSMRVVQGCVTAEVGYLHTFFGVTPRGVGVVVTDFGDEVRDNYLRAVGQVPAAAGGPLLRLENCVRTAAQLFCMLSRVAAEMDPEEPLAYSAEVRGIGGRHLVSQNAHFWPFVAGAPAGRKPTFLRRGQAAAGLVRAGGWRDEASKVVAMLCAEFPAPSATLRPEGVRPLLDRLFPAEVVGP